MKQIIFALLGAGALAGAVVAMAPASGQPDDEAAPIYGIELPQGYRDRRLISVSGLAAGKSDPALVEAHMAHKQLRAQLGNDIAIKAFREGKIPFPDGAIIAALHWNEIPSDENDKVLGACPSNAKFRNCINM